MNWGGGSIGVRKSTTHCANVKPKTSAYAQTANSEVGFDTARLSQLQSEIQSYTNATRSEWIMNGVTDEQFAEFEKQLYAYGLEEYLGIFQKYLDAFYGK